MAVVTEDTVSVGMDAWVQAVTGTSWFIVVNEGDVGIVFSETNPGAGVTPLSKGIRLTKGDVDTFVSNVGGTLWARSFNGVAKISPTTW